MRFEPKRLLPGGVDSLGETGRCAKTAGGSAIRDSPDDQGAQRTLRGVARGAGFRELPGTALARPPRLGRRGEAFLPLESISAQKSCCVTQADAVFNRRIEGLTVARHRQGNTGQLRDGFQVQRSNGFSDLFSTFDAQHSYEQYNRGKRREQLRLGIP
jgi:hypothetical protein